MAQGISYSVLVDQVIDSPVFSEILDSEHETLMLLAAILDQQEFLPRLYRERALEAIGAENIL